MTRTILKQTAENEACPELTVSRPPADHGPSLDYVDFESEGDNNSWIRNPHMGLAWSASGQCGQPNELYNGDCVVCGQSITTNNEEIIFEYLESTHEECENYREQRARTDAFQVGLRAGSVILVPR